MKSQVPELRVSAVNQLPPRAAGAYVLYWMIAARRPYSSFALERAVDWARELGLPLVVLEALGCGYRHASDRLHRFVLEGMAENARRFAAKGVLYHPYVEPEPGAGRGLVAALSRRAAVVVTDDYPGFGLPLLVRAAAPQVPVRLEAVDGNGLLPLRAAEAVFPTAYAFRRFLQKTLPAHLQRVPKLDPLRRANLSAPPVLAAMIARRWPRADERLLAADPSALAALPIDHGVAPVRLSGGFRAARRQLARFVEHRLDRYAELRNHPDEQATSGLSPYLHFGHLSCHEVLGAVSDHDPVRLAERRDGRRPWWGTGAGAEGFLDQLVTWRELGFNLASKRADHDRYESLPGWARRTLAEHAGDPRPWRYGAEDLEHGRTHDALWNAAQMELVREGTLHGYLRMLWGKKVLEWSDRPEQALERLVELNDRYALDGRDPSSTSGIFWIFGRYDRPWFPERAVFGTVRTMSSERTRRKVRVEEYLRCHRS